MKKIITILLAGSALTACNPEKMVEFALTHNHPTGYFYCAKMDTEELATSQNDDYRLELKKTRIILRLNDVRIINESYGQMQHDPHASHIFKKHYFSNKYNIYLDYVGLAKRVYYKGQGHMSSSQLRSAKNTFTKLEKHSPNAPVIALFNKAKAKNKNYICFQTDEIRQNVMSEYKKDRTK